MELLKVIVMLCQVSAGGMNITENKIADKQLECQKYYVRCVKETRAKTPTQSDETILMGCIDTK